MKRVSTIQRASKQKVGKQRELRGSKNVRELRGEIEALVRREALPMVECTVAEAKSGHFAAMKYLFEMVGLFPGTEDTEPEQDDSLAKILLQRLGMTDATPGIPASANGNPTIDDAVE
ncbi:MAG TPA: hypothetical protein VGF44_00555 [Terriglobales bacterium]|jgi:hypothetical protein